MLSRLKAIIDYISDSYFKLLAILLHFRFNKVNRRRYVRTLIKRFCPDDDGTLLQQAVSQSPLGVLSEEQCNKAYRRIIAMGGWAVFLVSFVLALMPDILWLNILAAVLDLAFFQSVLYVVMQKIMILYGREIDLNDDAQNSIQHIVAIDSSGLMLGKYPLLQKMKSVLGWASKQIVRRFGPQLVAKVSRYVFISLRRMAVKWLSVIVTKENLTFAFDALVPLTCAIISGLVSVVIIIPMCNKLRKHLLAEADLVK